MTLCYVCATLAPCQPYRLGGRGIVLTLLCADCGASFEALVAAWLSERRATPRQVALFGEAS